MSSGLMRRFSASGLVRWRKTPGRETIPIISALAYHSLPRVRDKSHGAPESEAWFSARPSHLLPTNQLDYPTPDERKLRLGKTIRILHDRLPTLLASPLPQDILSPQITLHLFPSTHPHLPTVTGRIAYTAALWTAPVAWGRIPVVGNVKLIILSERMVQNGDRDTSGDYRCEKLIVKWKSCGRAGPGHISKMHQGVSRNEEGYNISHQMKSDEEGDFCGLFIFEFDERGRILTHTIEHAEEGRNFDKTTKVISVTDWLLGKAWRKGSDEVSPGLALYDVGDGRGRTDPIARNDAS